MAVSMYRGDMKSGKRWWLFRHARKLYVLGIFLIFSVPVLFVFLSIEARISIYGFLLVLFLVLGSMLMVFQASAYANLNSITRELPPHITVADFDPLRAVVTLKEGEREYRILHHTLYAPYSSWVHPKHHILFSWDIIPEHYQVWTPVSGIECPPQDRYDFLEYVWPSGFWRLFSALKSSDQRENVFDVNLMEIVPHLYEEAKTIVSLRFAGFACERKETILLVLLTRYADRSQVNRVLELLKKIIQDIEVHHLKVQGEYGTWGWDEDQSATN